MDLYELLEHLRTDYVTGYEAALVDAQGQYELVAPEVVFQIDGGVYQHLYAVDLLVGAADAPGAVELSAEDSLLAPSAEVFYHSDLEISFYATSWGNMAFDVSIAPEQLSGFNTWFYYWMDLDATRRVQGEPFGGVVHSVHFQPETVSIDFGSAPVEAFVELLQIFEENGIHELRISSDF